MGARHVHFYNSVSLDDKNGGKVIDDGVTLLGKQQAQFTDWTTWMEPGQFYAV